MARKHKHEEHVNHERWLVSFADMMTLLFALFVVLYAMSAVDLEKVDRVKRSIQFAFHIEGDGGTQEEGKFSKSSGDGELLDSYPAITVQQQGMVEFVKSKLADEWDEKPGRSLEIVQNDDSVALTAPLDDFFVAGSLAELNPGIYAEIADLTKNSLKWASGVRLIIEYDHGATSHVIGGVRRAILADEVVAHRLVVLGRALKNLPKVKPHMVRIEAEELSEHRDRPPGGWEQRARIKLVYSTN